MQQCISRIEVTIVPTPSRKIRELFTLANDLHQDLITGSNAYNTFQLPVFDSLRAHPNIDTGIYRLCLFHIILALCKWDELYDKYHMIFPSRTVPASRSLREELRRRGFRSFRNTVVGHIWDKRTKRPLTTTEVDAKVQELTAPSTESFLMWINPDSADPNSVVSIVEDLREAIREEHGLTDADLL